MTVGVWPQKYSGLQISIKNVENYVLTCILLAVSDRIKLTFLK